MLLLEKKLLKMKIFEVDAFIDRVKVKFIILFFLNYYRQ
jgi:hypothetical protein